MTQSPPLFEAGIGTGSGACLGYVFFIRGVLNNLSFWPKEEEGISEARASPSANSCTQPGRPAFNSVAFANKVLGPISHIPAAKSVQSPGDIRPGLETRMRTLSSPTFQKSSREEVRGVGAGSIRTEKKQAPH